MGEGAEEEKFDYDGILTVCREDGLVRLFVEDEAEDEAEVCPVEAGAEGSAEDCAGSLFWKPSYLCVAVAAARLPVTVKPSSTSREVAPRLGARVEKMLLRALRSVRRAKKERCSTVHCRRGASRRNAVLCATVEYSSRFEQPTTLEASSGVPFGVSCSSGALW